MNASLFQVIVLLAIGYLIFLAKIFIPEYVKKKAENLAQSEDIENLTLLVKEVEFKFEERSQNLRARLDLLNQFQIDLHNEERNSIIQLHNIVYKYYTFLTDISLGGVDQTDENSLRKAVEERNILSNSLFTHYSNALLFLDEGIKNEISNLTGKISQIFTRFSNTEHSNYIYELSQDNLKYKTVLTKEKRIEYEEIRNKIYKDQGDKILELINEAGDPLVKLTLEIKRYLNIKTTRSEVNNT